MEKRAPKTETSRDPSDLMDAGECSCSIVWGTGRSALRAWHRPFVVYMYTRLFCRGFVVTSFVRLSVLAANGMRLISSESWISQAMPLVFSAPDKRYVHLAFEPHVPTTVNIVRVWNPSDPHHL